MRHAEGGGLTAEDRACREKVRLQAASMFEQDIDAVRIAKLLRVSTKSVYQWRRAWRTGGDAALVSKGQGGYACKLDERQLSRLRAVLDAGPAAYRWTEDQRWTLSRIAALIGRLFHVSCTLRGVSYLLHRMGFSGRSRRTGPPNAMRMRLPPGGRTAWATSPPAPSASSPRLSRTGSGASSTGPTSLPGSSARPDSASNPDPRNGKSRLSGFCRSPNRVGFGA